MAVAIDSITGEQISGDIEDTIRKTVERTLSIEKSEDCEVSVLLSDDASIHELNKQYRNVDAPTDVLAFAMREGVNGDLNRELLGDVVVSLPTARRQADDYGHSFETELSLLVCHGILHLLGYDHEEDNEAEVMRQKEWEILSSLGYDLAESGSPH